MFLIQKQTKSNFLLFFVFVLGVGAENGKNVKFLGNNEPGKQKLNATKNRRMDLCVGDNFKSV